MILRPLQNALPLPLSVPMARLTAELADSRQRFILPALVPFRVCGRTDLKQCWRPGFKLFQRFMGPVGAPSSKIKAHRGRIKS